MRIGTRFRQASSLAILVASVVSLSACGSGSDVPASAEAVASAVTQPPAPTTSAQAVTTPITNDSPTVTDCRPLTSTQWTVDSSSASYKPYVKLLGLPKGQVQNAPQGIVQCDEAVGLEHITKTTLKLVRVEGMGVCAIIALDNPSTAPSWGTNAPVICPFGTAQKAADHSDRGR